VAKDQFSFDVVSEVDLQEVHNAFDQARREIQTRFDFKNTGTEIGLDENLIEIRSETDHRLKAAAEVIKDKLVRRSISLKALGEGPILPAARGTVKQSLHINQGIDDEKARAINKAIKGAGLKVQTQIQKNQLRVTGRSKDDLQAVQRLLKDSDFGIPLQFTNYRP
jgi:uncharacterized protein YajQ (UPF0234 family)